jgi:alpha-beta hydrolase superfamily lysophospholipase
MSQLSADQRWHPDFLGAGFEALTMALTPDESDDEAVTATLVRATKPSGFASVFGDARQTDVLYVHGWSDYFFQTHVADFWRRKGARFFAIDLRRYGRNLQDASVGQLPGYVASLDTYDEEIELALTQMGHGRGATNRRKLILMGHSTGGLILSLWAARNPGRASALVLNSPWLELQTREVGRLALAPFIDTLSKYQPKNPIRASEPGFYMRSVSDAQDGEWSVNLEWHPNHSFPVFPGWLSAIIRGHQSVAQGLGLKIPILVLLSTRSLFAPVWDEQMKSCDVVVDVTGVAKRSLDLGGCTTVVRVDQAMHDVFLSKKAVREVAFDAIEQWLTGYRHSFDRGEPRG